MMNCKDNVATLSVYKTRIKKRGAKLLSRSSTKQRPQNQYKSVIQAGKSRKTLSLLLVDRRLFINHILVNHRAI